MQNFTNLTLNLTRLSTNKCFTGKEIDLNCVYTDICQQYSSYYKNTALALVLAYVVVDLLIPAILRRVWVKIDWEGIYRDNPEWAKYFDGRVPGKELQVEYWLKDRLLFAFAVFAGLIFYAGGL